MAWSAPARPDQPPHPQAAARSVPGPSEVNDRSTAERSPVPQLEPGHHPPAAPPHLIRPARERRTLPNRRPSHPRTALPRPSAHGHPGAATRRREMHARLSRERQAGTRPPVEHLRAMRGPGPGQQRPRIPLPGRYPVRYVPWAPQHSGLQRDKVTHGGTKNNGPPSREFPASGPFSQVVAGGGFEPPKA